MLKKLFILPLLAVTAAAQSTTPITHQVVLTENSDTSLTVTYDGVGLPVVLIAPDRWHVGTSAEPGVGYSVFATPEPEDPGEVNIIQFVSGGETGPFINILSDFKLSSDATAVIREQNGTPFSDGTDANGNAIMITFNDNAAASEVPDAASTAGLLLLSTLALAAVPRRAVAKS